jgi:hypothetical protein
MINRPAIDALFENVPPYTGNEQPSEFTFKVDAGDIGWVEVKTTTQFMVNGLLEQIEDRIAKGEYMRCECPAPEARIIKLIAPSHLGPWKKCEKEAK